MYTHLTHEELLKTTTLKAREIRQHTLELFDLLAEVDKRKLYFSLSYSSLFQYIVMELKFSDSQAAIYNQIIKAKVIEVPKLKEKINSGEISLFALSHAASEIREHKITDNKIKAQVIENYLGKTKRELRPTKQSRPIKPELLKKIEKLKTKMNLSHETDALDLLEFLIDEKLSQGDIKENKSITPKTKATLMVRAQHQCEYRVGDKRCTQTKYLEIDHIKPRALGGSNHPDNLRVLCREHNQYMGMNHFARRSL